jgi:PAS domain-containing protein
LVVHVNKLKDKILLLLRGDVTLRVAALEALRRGRAAVTRRRERAALTKGGGQKKGARLAGEFARMDASRLLAHFRAGGAGRFFAGFEEAAGDALARTFGADAEDDAVRAAEEIVGAGRRPLLGYGVLEFGAEPDWLRDPISGKAWPPDYHADVEIVRGDGSDIRVVWELNRLAHLVTLARAYVLTRDERFAKEAIRQFRHWRARNPVGFGPNWGCAMEAALRATNLLAAFCLIRRSPSLDEPALAELLSAFDEHGAHVRRNLEFSHLATSNHYLSDVAGLFWLGACLPELADARAWRKFGLRELLREMDKQVLSDGADAESSTGYHRLVAELFLYSFLLARENGVEIDERHRQRVRSMLEYARACLRPDGLAPLVGDTDSGRALPIAPRAADDHAYLIALGAALFDEPRFKVTERAPAEVVWLLGSRAAEKYDAMPDARPPASRAFQEAGTYVLRAGDLYLLFNASGAGLNGRGSHGHNDALSVELSACGACFLRDPGTYVYTRDLRARHVFRSTAYHSTVEVDGAEQNTTREELPFVIGDEARPRLVAWESDDARDFVAAEHDGYRRLPGGGLTHRRSVLFDKRRRFWKVEDSFAGAGRHSFRFFFHLAPGRDARALADGSVVVADKVSAARLFIVPLGAFAEGDASTALGAPAFEPRWSSRDYGEREESRAVCWSVESAAPLVARWALVPLCADEDEGEALKLVETLRIESV